MINRNSRSFKQEEQFRGFMFLILDLFHEYMDVVAVSDTYRDDISDGYSIPDEKQTVGYLPLAFSFVNWCKIDVFSLNIILLHHKKSQTINNNKNTK